MNTRHIKALASSKIAQVAPEIILKEMKTKNQCQAQSEPAIIT